MQKEYKGRVIFHIDMNAYFCSVACILYPNLRGEAFAIGRENSLKGVISTASYEARKYGIGSAMPLIEAYKILPSLKVIHIDYNIYLEYHYKFIEIIKRYSKIIEVASIDEVYVDMTEASLIRHPLVIAKEIQYVLLHELDLPASIGIGPTLFYAKMASDMKKPLGITILRKKDKEEKLYPLPVKDIYGIGKKTYPRLMKKGINTVADFMNLDNKELILSIIGEKQYNSAYNSILGNSTNIVDPARYQTAKSISESMTYDIPKKTSSDILLEVRRMARSLVNRINKDGYFIKTIVLTLRDREFNTITRRKTLSDYTDDYYEIIDVLEDLIELYYDPSKEYRLIGVGLANIAEAKDIIEYNLFTYESLMDKELNVKKVLDELRNKYGNEVIKMLGDKKK